MGFTLGPRSRDKTASRTSWQWILVLGIVVGGGVVGWLSARGIIGAPAHEAVREVELDPRPVITSLQKLGDLHTAKMTMKDVLQKNSERPAEGWLTQIPGGDALSRWATHNEVLVVAEGSVEAGIDLSVIGPQDVTQVSLPNGTQGLRVRLPRPTVYPPNVRLRVERSASGLMWKDENLIPKAQAEASRRFTDAAEKDHIRDHARENAVQQLQQMSSTLGLKNVEFTY